MIGAAICSNMGKVDVVLCRTVLRTNESPRRIFSFTRKINRSRFTELAGGFVYEACYLVLTASPVFS